MKKVFTMTMTLVLFMAFSLVNEAATVEGTINRIYSSQNGHFAILMQGGIPAEIREEACPTANAFAGWPYDAEKESQRSVIKSQLLAAMMANKKIILAISGCASGGNWMNISSVYLLNE